MSQKVALLDDHIDENEPLTTARKDTSSPFYTLLIIILLLVVSAILIFNAISFFETREFCSAPPVNFTSFYDQEVNDRFSLPPGSVLIKNVTIWTADETDQELFQHSILIVDGIIKEISPTIEPPPGWTGTTYDGQGRYLTPGIVDMHSHLGVASFPEDAVGLADTNEMTSPTTPQIRAMDGLNPDDPAIPMILSGGVTTSLVLPGSANVMGGEAAYVKLRGKTVGELLIPGAPRALKMACGENPKRVYGSDGKSPGSRMGVGWEFRRMFYDAARLLAEQDHWSCTGTGIRPQDLKLEPLTAVLRGEAMLNVHCYMVEDMEMVIRTAKEFGFQIKTFHHALEAWKIASLLAENNISVATFSDNWGFKMEGYDGSVHAPKILVDAGVNMVLKSDHPVIFAKYLLLEAAKSYHYGLTWQQAIRSITISAAKGLELDERLGSVEILKDGDVVIWDRFPFQLGAQPVKVFIEGKEQFSADHPAVEPIPDPTTTLTSTGPNACKSSTDPVVVEGSTVHTIDTANTVIPNATIVVEDGKITCLAAFPGCQTIVDGLINPTFYHANGGEVTPGFINTDAMTGRSEVDQEAATQDGESGKIDTRLVDGIRLTNYYNRHLSAAWKAGVTTIVSHQGNYYLEGGLSPVFLTVPGAILDDSLISEIAAVNFHIGDNVKYTFGSISAQFTELRKIFIQANSTGEPAPIEEALNGILPVVFHVDQVDEIMSVLRLLRDFKFPLIIKGGAEAHLVARHLAVANVSVLLRSPQAPSSFETWHASQNASKILSDAGVRVGLFIEAAETVRNLRWEAGIIMMQQGVSYDKALAMITKNVAEMYMLPDQGTVEVNKPANFVVFDGNSLSLKSHVLLVLAGNNLECNPIQFKKRNDGK